MSKLHRKRVPEHACRNTEMPCKSRNFLGDTRLAGKSFEQQLCLGGWNYLLL